jgi:hypothetical protein
MKTYSLTLPELNSAQKAFEANEPRDLFYRAATELVDLALRNATSISLAEALAVLLQTWNRSFYQYRRFNSQHFLDIENLLNSNQQCLLEYRNRSIDSFVAEDEYTVQEVFQDFEKVLGPVGAAKALHLLAPQFFPIWDRTIAETYNLPLGQAGTNGKRYYLFMKIAREQVQSIGGASALGRNPLKAIDEYNYCKYTKRWIP